MFRRVGMRRQGNVFGRGAGSPHPQQGQQTFGGFTGNSGFQNVGGVQNPNAPGRGGGVATAPFRGGAQAAPYAGVQGGMENIYTKVGGSSGPTENVPFAEKPKKPIFDHLPGQGEGDEAAAHGEVLVLDPYGKKIPHPKVAEKWESFSDSLPDWLREGLSRLRFETPTPIQQYTIPPMLDGKDVIGLAPTGAGKTLAFAVPLLAKITDESINGFPQIVILCPVRELAAQIAKVCRQLVAPHGGIKVAELFGGASRKGQATMLWAGADIIVATPGRLYDFLRCGDTDFRNLKALVFDEADRMLDEGFAPQLKEVMNYMDPTKPKVTSMWSATWPKDVENAAYALLKPDRVMIRAGDGAQGLVINPNIQQHIEVVQNTELRANFIQALVVNNKISRDAKGIFFVETKAECDDVCEEVCRLLGVPAKVVAPLHGGMDQYQRDATMMQFRAGRVRILVTTNVMARGLDFPQLEYVINYDAPKSIDDYVHRIGRCGRVGQEGHAWTFLIPGANMGTWMVDLRKYMERCKLPVPEDLSRAAQAVEYEAMKKEQAEEERARKKEERLQKFGRGKGRDRAWQKRPSYW